VPFELTGQQIAFLAILGTTIALLVTERLRNDLVAVLVVVALVVSGLLEPKDALAGFGSEPAIVVAAIFVLSAALHQTGVSETTGRWIGRLAGRGYTRIVAVLMPAVALLSAFTHHLTTTAVMLPVTLDLARAREIPASKLLMPLSFAASLGTTITLIGAPAFLIASSVLQQAGRPGLGIFSIAPIGLTLSLVGTIFVLVIGRWLLPARAGGETNANRFRLDEYFTEVTILPDSPLLDRTVAEVEGDDRYRFDVVGWLRHGRRQRPPFADQRLGAGDVLLVRAAPEQMVAFHREAGVDLHPIAQYGTNTKRSDDVDLEKQLVQAVVAPGSDLVGRTIGDVDVRRRYGAIVLALWRRDGWLEQELARTALRVGDVLVLQGDTEALDRVATDRAFLMLVPFHGETRLRQRAPLAAAIMVATVLVAALGGLSIEIAAVAGAAAMVLLRCITAGQAYRAIEARIYVFIAGAIPLGAAMTKSGTSAVMAGWLQGVLSGASPFVILLGVFAVVAVITQFMSDAATTAIFAPVSVALAQSLGHSPEPYVVTVAMAAVTAFLTPIGHHGNLLVYTPGGYRFADFVCVGAPLTAVIGVVVALLAPLLWPS
jgi:di/tricarboxylate transporter